jgi:hypothetical protein
MLLDEPGRLGQMTRHEEGTRGVSDAAVQHEPDEGRLAMWPATAARMPVQRRLRVALSQVAPLAGYARCWADLKPLLR